MFGKIFCTKSSLILLCSVNKVTNAVESLENKTLLSVSAKSSILINDLFLFLFLFCSCCRSKSLKYFLLLPLLLLLVTTKSSKSSSTSSSFTDTFSLLSDDDSLKSIMNSFNSFNCSSSNSLLLLS